MFTLPSPAALFAGLLFSGVGFIAFSYGRKMQAWRLAAGGAALMVYPYFIDRTWLIYAIGVAICTVLYFFRD